MRGRGKDVLLVEVEGRGAKGEGEVAEAGIEAAGCAHEVKVRGGRRGGGEGVLLVEGGEKGEAGEGKMCPFWHL